MRHRLYPGILDPKMRKRRSGAGAARGDTGNFEKDALDKVLDLDGLLDQTDKEKAKLKWQRLLNKSNLLMEQKIKAAVKKSTEGAEEGAEPTRQKNNQEAESEGEGSDWNGDGDVGSESGGDSQFDLGELGILERNGARNPRRHGGEQGHGKGGLEVAPTKGKGAGRGQGIGNGEPGPVAAPAKGEGKGKQVEAAGPGGKSGDRSKGEGKGYGEGMPELSADEVFANQMRRKGYDPYIIVGVGVVLHDKNDDSLHAHCPVHKASRSAGFSKCHVHKVLSKRPVGYVVSWMLAAKNYNVDQRDLHFQSCNDRGLGGVCSYENRLAARDYLDTLVDSCPDVKRLLQLEQHFAPAVRYGREPKVLK